jgi:hypothetical protein
MTASPALKVEAYEPALPVTVPGVGMSSIPRSCSKCAALDDSDTDNARRRLAHFGEDLLVVAQAKAKAPLFAVWDGRRWDLETGGPCAVAIAQKLGGGAAAGAWSHMTPTPRVSKNTGAPKLTGAPISRRSGVAGQS